MLRGSDIQFKREHRLDIALVKNMPIALVFLPAADIPTFVGEGRVDLGITGRDQVAEHDHSAPSAHGPGWDEVLDLEFGNCRLQVQVPENGAISRAEQLIGKHVATSFVHLASAFFARLEQRQREEGREGEERKEEEGGGGAGSPSCLPEPRAERKLDTKIVHVGGSVETACALGVADGIVDLVGQSFP